MKFSSFLPILALSLAILAVSCKNEPKNTDTTSSQPKPDTIQVPPPLSKEGATPFAVSEGVVYWQGHKATGSKHNGTIKVKSGELLVKEGQLLGGKVVIDMNSLAVSDLKDAGERSDLESHLKDSDFFETNKYPEAIFSFEEILPSKNEAFNAVITGTLEMKGKKSDVNVPVKLNLSGNSLDAQSATFIINRTKWGVNFNSGILGTAKDKLIEDNVTVSLTLKAAAR